MIAVSFQCLLVLPSAHARDFRSKHKRGYRKRAKSSIFGFLFQDISGTKEKRQTQTSHRPESPKQVSGDTQIQNANHATLGTFDATQGLCSVTRLGGRILPCSNSEVVSQVPQVCVQRDSLAIQVPPIRDIYGTLRLHQAGSTAGDVSSAICHSPPPVHR